jgi:hypothetical protein
MSINTTQSGDHDGQGHPAAKECRRELRCRAAISSPRPSRTRASHPRRGREAIARTGRSAVVNIWVDPREYAPGTKNQTMYQTMYK